MIGRLTSLVAATLVVAAAQTATAQQVFPLERARALALQQVSDNEGVKSAKLKNKDGVMVYEFDIETPGPGHREVRVDARTGSLLYSNHEDDLVGRIWHGGKKDKEEKTMSSDSDRVFTDEDIDRINPPISLVRATRIAQRQSPGAPAKDVDLETEDRVLVWEIDLDTPGEGYDEVVIDAYTGKVLRVSHQK